MLQILKQLQVNLGMQGASDQLNNVYKLVQR